MPTMNSANVRKAAILIRSLDEATAERLLDQLSPAEVSAVRQAIIALGELDDDERADVAAELRRASSATVENRTGGVEIELGTAALVDSPPQDWSTLSTASATARFAFLDNAAPHDLAQVLMREHPQTVAVILSMLNPRRAADVLTALSEAVQMRVLDRLADLGDADPECLEVIEHELMTWAARQPLQRAALTGNGAAHAERIIQSADPAIRRGWISRLESQHRVLAERLRAALLPQDETAREDFLTTGLTASGVRPTLPPQATIYPPEPATPLVPPPAPPQTMAGRRPTIPFDALAAVDARTMAAIFREVDANVLQLALAGADEGLVDRVAAQLPKRAARQFRARLHQLGPTRLRDVEAAQQMVAEVATRMLSSARTPLAAHA